MDDELCMRPQSKLSGDSLVREGLEFCVPYQLTPNSYY